MNPTHLADIKAMLAIGGGTATFVAESDCGLWSLTCPAGTLAIHSILDVQTECIVSSTYQYTLIPAPVVGPNEFTGELDQHEFDTVVRLIEAASDMNRKRAEATRGAVEFFKGLDATPPGMEFVKKRLRQ